MVKIYIINLKRRLEKRERMQKQLDKYNIPNSVVEWVEAVDGYNLDDNYFNENNIKIYPWYDPFSNRAITKGEVGCALSHIKVWERIIETDDAGIILEDDAELCDNFLFELMDRLRKVSSEYDLMYLGRKKMTKDVLKINDEQVSIPGKSYWCIGYLLKPEGAKILLHPENNYKRNLIPVDEYIPLIYEQNNVENYIIKHKLKALALDPSIVKPFNGAFNISDTEKSEPFNMLSNIVNNVHDVDIHVVLFASNSNPAFDRNIESLKKMGYKYTVYGMGKKWGGGDMKSSGGGQKIIWMSEFLNSDKISKMDSNTFIIHSDAYDVIWQLPVTQLKMKLKKIRKPILFGAETSCWPDTKLADKYPESSTQYKYLNSGLFIARLKELKEMINQAIKENIKPSDDDQLFYTKYYLNNLDKIDLDTKCKYFWNMGQTKNDFQINYEKSLLTVKSTKTNPYAIHGNGTEVYKILLNRIADYIPNIYRPTYGSFRLHNITELPTELPLILIYIPLGIIPHLEYPKDRLIIVSSKIDFDTVHDQEEYKALIELNIGNMPEHVIRRNCVQMAQEMGCDYYFSWDKKQCIKKSNIINKLLEVVDLTPNKIVSYLLKQNGSSLFSSFWGELTSNGYYKRSFDYIDIVNRKFISLWNVPYVNNNFFVHKSSFSHLIKGYNSEYYDNDPDMSVCKYLRNNKVEIYLDNREIYGST